MRDGKEKKRYIMGKRMKDEGKKYFLLQNLKNYELLVVLLDKVCY